MTHRPPVRSILAAGALVAACAGLGAGCAQFQPVALYSGVEAAPPPERPRTVALAVEPVIYADQADDTVWFQDDTRCTQGRLTEDVVSSGSRAVEVSWDRAAEGCEWAGLGFGWDHWAGKDISELLPYAAVQMRVRTRQGTMYGLPIVLTLEDYSGGMGFAYTENRYFERSFIDEEWQTVTVPLAAFDLEVEHLDPTNVKQLMFELQQSGSIYLDDVRLVFYEAPVQAPWLVEAPRPSPTALPITLFGDAFINGDGWGLVTDACQSVQIADGAGDRGSVLHLQWDARPETCYEGVVGVSWDEWHPVDVTPIAERAAIQFDVRLASGTSAQLPIRVALEDYSRRVSQIILDARYTASGRFTTEWQTVTIPFAELRGGGRALAAAPATAGNLPAFRDGADLSTVKQLVFYLDEAGDVFVDNLRLVDAR